LLYDHIAPGITTGGNDAPAASTSSSVQPTSSFSTFSAMSRKPVLRPLVMLRSCRIVIWSPLGTPSTHVEMRSSSDTLPSPTS